MGDKITITHCKNCETQITGYNFCPNCGAKKITRRITFKNLVNELIERFFNLDNSIVKTFIHLFTKPEEVIDGYIQGMRKRYINAFGYFAISLTILGLYSFFLEDTLREFSTSGSPTEAAIKANKAVMDFIFKYQTILNFSSIPLLAMVSKVVFLNYKKYNFTEHLVIYLYAYSHIVTIVTLVLIPITLLEVSMEATLLQFPVYIIYIAYVLKRLYNLSWKKIILKTLLFFLVSGVFYIIVSIILSVLIVLTGIIDLKDLQELNAQN